MSFIVCATLATALVAYAPPSFLNFWLNITLATTRGIGFLLGLTVTSSGDIMTVNGFDMRIITQCTALHYVIILSSGILLYTTHPMTYRLAGLFFATIFIIFANAVRLIITGVVGSISWDAFVIVHDYLWVAGFSLLVLAVWIIWADRRFDLSLLTFKKGSFVLIVCAAAYGLLLCAMPFYGKFMAQITSPLFKTLIIDPDAGILFDGQRMHYQYAGSTFSVTFATDLMAVSLYLGLFLSNGDYGKVAVKRALLGIMVILSVSVITIAGGGILNVISGSSAAVVFLWTMHGLLLLLAIVWWMQRRVPRPATNELEMQG